MSVETNSLAELATNTAPEQGETEQKSVAAETELDPNVSNETNEDDAGTDETNEDAEGEKKPKRGFDKRIAKEIARRTSAQQEAEYWKKVALERGTPQPAAAGTQEVPKPKFADYNDIEAYTEAVTDWKVEQKLQASLQQREQQSAQRSVEQSYNERVAAFVKVQPDFQEVLAASELQISKPVTDLIFESDVGPAIVYYLAENEEETERINKLSPARQLAEIGKIEAKLAVPRAAEKKIVSKAPAPVKPVTGSAPVVKKSLDDPSLSAEEWIKLRNKTRNFR